MNTHTSSLFPISADRPWLAPLAGFSDLPFRLLCKEQGAMVTCTEMVSAKGLIYGLTAKKTDPQKLLAHYITNSTSNTGTEDLLSTTDSDSPLVVQLFGAEESFMAAATDVLVQRGYTAFDINMGCSVTKVTKTGAGAAMLKQPDNAILVTKGVVKAAGKYPVGVKIRLGWDSSTPIYLDLARRLEDAGAAWITLHPRYAKQGFSGCADYIALAKLSKALQIPVIASGDLFSAQDGIECITQTGVAAVMFARGALHNPMIFKEFLSLLAGQPYHISFDTLKSVVYRHAALAKEYTPGKTGRKGLSPALLKMRTVVPRYLRNFPHIRQLRLALTFCENWDDFTNTVEEYFMRIAQQELL